MHKVWMALCLLLLAASAGYAVTATGLVLGPDEEPVAGADVYVQPAGGDYREVRRAQTDESGRFSVSVPPHHSWPDFLGRLNVHKAGLALAGGSLRDEKNVYHLSKPGQAWGTVVDERGRPVAGGPVRLLIYRGDHAPSLVLLDALHDRFTATTTADGRWALSDVPTTGKLTVLLDDPRFEKARADVILGPGAPESEIVARPGASISGRVVYPDGLPAAGIEVFAQAYAGMGWDRDTTAPYGGYRLVGLSPDTYNVMVDDPSGEWIAVAVEGLSIARGQDAAAGDIALTRGAIVQGTVVDDETGEPIPGVYIGSYGPHRPRSTAAIIGTRTDERGRYRLRVAPGKSYVYISGPPRAYLSPRGGVDAVLEEGETEMIDFELTKGETVSGIAVDEESRPAAGARLVINVVPKPTGEPRVGVVPTGSTMVGDDGGFAFLGLEPGKATLAASGEWRLVEPEEFAVPPEEPLRVVLRRLEMLTLSGRVVTAAGDPLPGVTVSAEVRTPERPEMPAVRTREAVSGSDGAFAISDLRPDAEVILSVEKDGYRRVSGGEITRIEDQFDVTDIVMGALAERLRGRVLAPDGDPAAGAKVLCPTVGLESRTVADYRGWFELAEMPQGVVTILAADSTGYTEAEVKTGGSRVEIALKARPQVPPNDIERGRDLLEHLWRQSEGAHYYARDSLPAELAGYDPEGALRIASQGVEAPSDWALYTVMYALIEVDPGRAAEWIPPKLELLADPNTRASAAAHLCVAIGDSRPDVAAPLYEAVKSLPRAPSEGEEEGQMSYLFSRWLLAAAAAKLHRPEAASLVDDAVSETKRFLSGGRGPGGMLAAGVEVLARGSAELAGDFADGLPEDDRFRAFARAVEQAAQYDPAGALRLLERMGKPGDESTDPYYYGLAAKNVIKAVGETDPGRALAIARTVTSEEQRAMALALAAQYQSRATRWEVFGEAMDFARGPGEMARIANLAYDSDRDLGIGLFTQAYEAMEGSESGRAGLTQLAFYYARVDPAESRLLLELEFADRLEHPDPRNPGWSLMPVCLATAAVDVDRALEMTGSIPEDEAGARFDARRKIAQYILAPEDVRRSLHFDRWTASDTWIPGTRTGW